jgi:hypothetical protein
VSVSSTRTGTASTIFAMTLMRSCVTSQTPSSFRVCSHVDYAQCLTQYRSAEA